MPIIKSKSIENYTYISNNILLSTDLTLVEKGLLVYLLSVNPNFNLNVENLPSILVNDNESSIKKAFNSLRKKGYIVSVEKIDSDKNMIGYENFVYENPVVVEDNKKTKNKNILHSTIIKEFSDYYKKEKGINYIFVSGKDGNAVKFLIVGLMAIVKVKDDESVLKAFRLSLVHLKGHWVYDNLSLSNYNSKINSIIDHTRKMIEQEKKPKSLTEKQRFNNSKEDTSFRRTSFTIK